GGGRAIVLRLSRAPYIERPRGSPSPNIAVASAKSPCPPRGHRPQANSSSCRWGKKCPECPPKKEAPFGLRKSFLPQAPSALPTTQPPRSAARGPHGARPKLFARWQARAQL